MARRAGWVLMRALAGHDLLYLSGISLAIWGEPARAVLFDLLDEVHRRWHVPA